MGKSNFVSWFQITDAQMTRCINIRSYMAESGKSDTPLSWFSGCIEVLFSGLERFASETMTFLFVKLATAISRSRSQSPQVKQLFTANFTYSIITSFILHVSAWI
jgi:hypothetical protein